MALHVWVNFHPKAGMVDAVAAVLARLPPVVRAEPGCRRFDFYRCETEGEGTTFHFAEIYDDQAAIEAHRRFDHYIAYRAAIMPLLSSPPDVRLLTAVDVAAT